MSTDALCENINCRFYRDYDHDCAFKIVLIGKDGTCRMFEKIPASKSSEVEVLKNA